MMNFQIARQTEHSHSKFSKLLQSSSTDVRQTG